MHGNDRFVSQLLDEFADEAIAECVKTRSYSPSRGYQQPASDLQVSERTQHILHQPAFRCQKHDSYIIPDAQLGEYSISVAVDGLGTEI